MIFKNKTRKRLRKNILFFWATIGVVSTILGLILGAPDFYDLIRTKGIIEVSVLATSVDKAKTLSKPLLISNDKIKFVHINLPFANEKKISICSQLYFSFETTDSKILKDTIISFTIIDIKTGKNKIYKTPYGNFLSDPENACSFDHNMVDGKTYSGKEKLSRSINFKNVRLSNNIYNRTGIKYNASDIYPKTKNELNFSMNAVPNILLLTEKNGKNIYETDGGNEIISSIRNDIYVNFRPYFISISKTLSNGNETEIGNFKVFFHLAKTRADLLVNAKLIDNNYYYREFSSISDIFKYDKIEHIFLSGRRVYLPQEEIEDIARQTSSNINNLNKILEKEKISKTLIISSRKANFHCRSISFFEKIKSYFRTKLGVYGNLEISINSKSYVSERNKLRTKLALLNTMPYLASQRPDDFQFTEYLNNCETK